MKMNHDAEIDVENAVKRAILELKDRLELREGTPEDTVRKAVRVVMRKHPEMFWFSNQYRYYESKGILYLHYNFNQAKKDFYNRQIDNVVRYLFQPGRLMMRPDMEQVAYVYKWIARNTTYNEYSAFNQTIYSVLINRNSVCTGYAKTAQYLLRKVGIESELVFGKFHADKSEEGRHCWNLVKIDGEWYHVDFCLADPELKHLLDAGEEPVMHDGLMWNYFCRSSEYMLRNRSIEFADQYPECKKDLCSPMDVTLAEPFEMPIVCKSDLGSTSQVFLDPFDKDSVIKNCIVKGGNGDFAMLDNESAILGELTGCRHIVRSKGLTERGLILEQLTPWSELLHSHYYHPGEKDLKEILIQLTQGLIECRNHGITYSDIHYNNVLVAKDGTFKWGDFGIAFHSTPDGKLPPQLIGEDGIPLGSRWFMAPETYKNHVFNENSAVYSLAMVAYFVMNGMHPPFWSKSLPEEEALKRLREGRYVDEPLYSSSFGMLSHFVCDIINRSRSIHIRSFEDFIMLLKCDERDVIPSSPCFDDSVMCDSGCDPMLIDSVDDIDVFARTMLIPQNGGIYESDARDFVSAVITPGNSGDNDYIVLDDTDSYASTCFASTRRPPHVAQEMATTFSPAITNHEQKRSLIRRLAGKVFWNFWRTDKCGYVDTTELAKEIEDNISACVYAPAEVRPRKSFIIRVYMYRAEEQTEVDSKVREIDPKAVKKEYKPLDLPVKEGDKLTVQLSLSEGVLCKETSKSVIWKGHYTDCSFMAKLTDENQESIEGSAYIFVNDLPAGEMLFTIDVIETSPREIYAKVDAHRFSKIFISYAHQDENQVRGIAEGCRMLGKDYFFDRHSLKAGDIFKEKIFNYINDADLFVLCWSKNAAESRWVKIEREHALELISAGKSSLSIYPLSLRPEAPLPMDMSSKYNFGML